MSDDTEGSAAMRGSVAIGKAQETGYNEWYCKFYLCQACGNNDITDWFSYCPRCGRKVVSEFGSDVPNERCTPPPQTTPGEGSVPSEGTSEPVAWHIKGCEYDTGCEFEYATLDRGQAEAAASERCKVAPLYREPVAAWRLVHENERLRDEVARLRLTDEERTEVSRLIEDYEQDGEPGSERCVSTLRGLLERTK